MQYLLDLFNSNQYASAFIILAASVLAAALTDWIITRILLRIAARTKTNLDDEIIRALHRPLFLTVVLIGASLALRRIIPEKNITVIYDGIFMTVATLVWMGAGWRISRSFLSILADRTVEHRYIQVRTIPLFDMAVKTILIGGAAYGILLIWDVDVTAWLASAGILGIALGFAAKDSLANLFSGIFILADAPYKIGDFIILDSGERGLVTDIGVRSTRILTRDDIQIIIPNSVIAASKIINESGGRHIKERVRVRVGVAYGSDIDKVREVLMQVASESEHLVSDPEPRVRFRNFGESSLDFELLGWIDEPVLRGRALDRLNVAVYEKFRQNNIQIPFPQRDVHMKSGGTAWQGR